MPEDSIRPFFNPLGLDLIYYTILEYFFLIETGVGCSMSLFHNLVLLISLSPMLSYS